MKFTRTEREAFKYPFATELRVPTPQLLVHSTASGVELTLCHHRDFSQMPEAGHFQALGHREPEWHFYLPAASAFRMEERMQRRRDCFAQPKTCQTH